MWCSPSSVSFSQRTRTVWPVCSDESSQRCRKFANDSWRVLKNGLKGWVPTWLTKQGSLWRDSRWFSIYHMSFLSISSGYHFSRWKRMGQVCNDTYLMSFDGLWISSRTGIIDIMMLVMSWNMVLHCDVWWCFIHSDTSTIGRVRWKIPGKSKVLIPKTKKNHVGAKEQVHMHDGCPCTYGCFNYI